MTAALQSIGCETLEQIDLYDEGYRLCFEDVDYCLRVFQAGLDCIYEPSELAMHHESYVRRRATPEIERWTRESTARMKDAVGRRRPVPLGSGDAVTEHPKTLFMSRGNKGAGWYRAALPALALGADWTCYVGEPPNAHFVYGRIERELSIEDVTDYEVVVIQQPRGAGWLGAIRDWQRRGVIVLADVDDWLRGIKRKTDHDFSQMFGRKAVEEFELCMRAVDGIICSTPWLAERYVSLNPRTYLCRNGIDLKRYALTIPERDYVGIGWSGATGHKNAVLPWIAEVTDIMRERDDVHFVSVGQRFAQELQPEFGQRRAVAVPFTALDTYPASMTLYDIALAPAGDSSFYRGKSDLRWLEASAIGQPLVADPVVYPDIEHGVTGFHASTPAEMGEIVRELVEDEDLRLRVGAAAKAYVTEHRSAQVAAEQWVDVLRGVASPALAA